MDAGFKNGLFTSFANGGIHFFLRLVHHFFDARRMNAAINDELFKSNARHFATDWLEAGKHDGFRRIVDDEIDASEIFQGANVAAFATNDATCHLVVWQRNN